MKKPKGDKMWLYQHDVSDRNKEILQQEMFKLTM